MNNNSKIRFHFSTIFIVLMLVSYFIPWISFGGHNITALEIPDILNKINALPFVDNSFLEHSYVFYLPLIFTIITILADVFFDHFHFIPLLLLFISLIIVSVYLFGIVGNVWQFVDKPIEGPTQYISFGFYLAWISFLLAFAIEFIIAVIMPILKKLHLI